MKHWRDDYISSKDVGLGVKDQGDATNEELKQTYLNEVRNAKCGIYMATSTIPNSGKGLYLGVTIPSEGIDLVSAVQNKSL